jgi:hypothetical protein
MSDNEDAGQFSFYLYDIIEAVIEYKSVLVLFTYVFVYARIHLLKHTNQISYQKHPPFDSVLKLEFVLTLWSRNSSK